MSAFLCTPKHIGAIARVLPLANRAHVARVLAKENIRSVGYRYDHANGDETETFLGMSKAYYLALCEQEATEMKQKEMDPGDVLKLLDSYEYQSCECNDWETSMAYHLCKNIRTRLPEKPNHNAPWTV